MLWTLGQNWSFAQTSLCRPPSTKYQNQGKMRQIWWEQVFARYQWRVNHIGNCIPKLPNKCLLKIVFCFQSLIGCSTFLIFPFSWQHSTSLVISSLLSHTLVTLSTGTFCFAVLLSNPRFPPPPLIMSVCQFNPPLNLFLYYSSFSLFLLWY